MSKQVKIAGEDHTVEGMSAFKFELIGDKLMTLMERVPGVDREWANKVKEFRSENYETLGRATAQYTLGGPPTDAEGRVLTDLEGRPLPGMLDHITPADWENEKDPEGNAAPHTLTRRFNPSENAELAFYFEQYFKLARENVIDILATLITPNTDLETAHCDPPQGTSGDQAVEERVGEHRRLLRYRAEFAELFDVFLAAVDEIVETLEARQDRLGNLRRLRNLGQPQRPALTVVEGGQASESDETPPPPDGPTPSSGSTPPSTPERIPSPSSEENSAETPPPPPAATPSEPHPVGA